MTSLKEKIGAALIGQNLLMASSLLPKYPGKGEREKVVKELKEHSEYLKKLNKK